TNNYLLSHDNDNRTIPPVFKLNDIVRCQVWNGSGTKYYVGRVTQINNLLTVNVYHIEILEGTGVPAVGDVVVRTGNTVNTARQGSIYLTSSDTNAPYIDVMDGVN